MVPLLTDIGDCLIIMWKMEFIHGEIFEINDIWQWLYLVFKIDGFLVV